MSNIETFIRNGFVSLGVSQKNIKSIHHSPGGFAANPRRYCIVFYRVPGLSAVQINGIAGVSGAVWNGNVCHIILEKGIEKMATPLFVVKSLNGVLSDGNIDALNRDAVTALVSSSRAIEWLDKASDSQYREAVADTLAANGDFMPVESFDDNEDTAIDEW